ncbi:hypothetical protein Tco_0459047 [Tanacetum coccineum]
MAGSQDDIPPPPPPPSQTPTQQQTPHTVSTIKLLILKKGEYDIWAMKMEHYLAHTDYPIWEVIQNGNGPVSITTDTQGQIKVLPPRTAEEILARERERKARTTLLMALPEDHLAKFHKMTDAKEMWEAIKSRFGGNDESKKMQKYILKQQFEGFSVSNSEGLHKGYDRTKPGVGSLSFDDLYNNLRVFESDVKGSTASSSSTQNMAFVSKNTSSTNDVSTAYGVSNSSSHNSQYEQTSSYSLLANQSSCPQLDHEDLEQLDEFDLEEIDLKWNRLVLIKPKSIIATRQGILLESVEPREIKVVGGEMLGTLWLWNSRIRNKEIWEKTCSGSDIEVQSCSNECVTSYNKLKKLYDEQRAQLSDASIEIKAYTQALKKVEVQLVAHQQGQLWYKEKIRYDGILSYENEVLQSVFMNKESDLEKQPLYDRFATAGGMHVVPLPMTGNYMPSRTADVEIELLSYLTYVQTIQIVTSETQTSDFDTCESDCSVETHESLPEPIVNATLIVNQPKVWSDAPIIEEYESDSEDEHVSQPTKEQEQPSFASTNKQVKTPRETVKNQFTHSKNLKVDKKGLGYGFTARACFVCGSLSHLIRDCDFPEKQDGKKMS